MANIIRSTADTAGFIPQVWAQRALDILRENIVLVRRVARDSDYEPGWQGKQLNIPYPGTFTAQSKTEGTAATVQTPTGGATVSVTLSNHKYVDFIVEDYANAQANSQLLDRYVRPSAIALGSSLTGTSVGTSGTDITAATVRSARKVLNDAKVPLQDRTLIVSDKDEIALLGDASLQNYWAMARPEGVAEGSLGRLYGFDVFVSQLVPVVNGTPNSTKNLAFHRDAMLLATRPFRDLPAGSGVQAASIVDPETGLALRVLYQYDMANRGVHVGYDILYGVVALRPGSGSVVLS